MESLLAIAFPEVDNVYDDVLSYNASKGIYHMSPHEVSKSLETEETIYDTPYQNKVDFGVVYHTPADNEQKIYEEFAGKKFHRLYHKEIKLVYLSIYRATKCMHCHVFRHTVVRRAAQEAGAQYP